MNTQSIKPSIDASGATVLHPLYAEAAQATHSRPALPVAAPAQVHHAVFLVGEANPQADRARFTHALQAMPGWQVLQEGHAEARAANGSAHLKWERHTEFLTLTMVVPDGDSSLSADFPPLLVAMTAHLVDSQTAPASPEGQPSGEPAGLFSRMHLWLTYAQSPDDLTVSPARATGTSDPLVDPSSLEVLVSGGAVRLSTDLRHDHNGVIVYRALLSPDDNQTTSPARIGRFVQRVIEVESYRLLAYLAVPMMQRLGPKVSELESRVNDSALRAANDPKPDEEEAILTELTNLSAELQAIGSASEFRFAASLAYAAIVDERLDALRETRIEGFPRLSHAVKRRLDPAMRSANALLARQQKIAGRIGYITDLLRTRVDLTLQEQNAEVLRSIDARANAQLRLQKAVEGLSVAAITYYALGILGYLIKGTDGWPFGVSVDLLQAIVVIPVALLVFLGLRIARNRAQEGEDAD